MVEAKIAPSVSGYQPGQPLLLVFFEADCPTCQIPLPCLNSLKDFVRTLGISQDDEPTTREFVARMGIRFPVQIDKGLELSRSYDPHTVPSMFLVDEAGRVQRTLVGFDKASLNELAHALGQPAIAPEHDG